jgi:hypothetical protein
LNPESTLAKPPVCSGKRDHLSADEIEKLDRLKKAGSISDAEFARLRTKLVS